MVTAIYDEDLDTWLFRNSSGVTLVEGTDFVICSNQECPPDVTQGVLISWG